MPCKLLLLSVIFSFLSACGSTTTDRAVSGGAIGAGAGALGSAATGGSPATGAILGGAAGAVVGGATKQRSGPQISDSMLRSKIIPKKRGFSDDGTEELQ